MSERVDFELNLTGNAATAAQKAADALARVESSAKKAQQALNFHKELSRAEQTLGKIKADPKGFRELIKAQAELTEQRKKLRKEFGQESFSESFKKSFGFGKLFSAAFAGEVVAEGFMKGAEKAVDFIKEGVKLAFESASKLENLQLGYKLSLGAEGGKESLEDISRFSKQTGLGEDSIAKLLLPLRRAGLDQKSARTAFAAAGDIAAGSGEGGNVEAIGGILDTLKNIKLKGGVSKKMLPGIGVDVQSYFADLGKQLHVSKEQAEKLAGEGKIDPQRLLNTIYKQVEARQGGKLGTGVEAYQKTFEGKLTKLKALPEEYLKQIVSSPGWSKITEKMQTVLEALSPESPRGQRIIASLTGAFDKLVTVADNFLKPETVDKFGSALAAVPGYLDKIVTISEVIATIWAGSQIVGAFTALSAILPTLGTAAGVVVSVLGAAAAPVLAIAAAVGSVALAVHETKKALDEVGGVGQAWKDFKDYFTDGDPRRYGDAVNAPKPSVPTPKARPALSMTIPKIDVHVTPPKDDTNHTGQKVGQEVYEHTVMAFERAAQQAGM